MGMKAVSPAGEHSVCSTGCMHRANSMMFGRSVVNRSHGEKHHRILDVVLVREAGAAHSTSPVLNETNLMAVGQHSIGARP
jgi:hypothetical protein